MARKDYKSDEERFAALLQPFQPQHLEWRVQTSGVSNKKPWAKVLAYIESRAAQTRLDDVFGPQYWMNEVVPLVSGDKLIGYTQRIGIRMEDGLVVTKEDGAQLTAIEAVKGGLSDAFKRCCVMWGIGRYLYDMPTPQFANFVSRGRGRYSSKIGDEYYEWNPPRLEPGFLPAGYSGSADVSAPTFEEPQGDGGQDSAQSSAQTNDRRKEREEGMKEAEASEILTEAQVKDASKERIETGILYHLKRLGMGKDESSQYATLAYRKDTYTKMTEQESRDMLMVLQKCDNIREVLRVGAERKKRRIADAKAKK